MPYVFYSDSAVKYSTEEEASTHILNSDDKASKVIKTDWRHDRYMDIIWATATMLIKSSVNNISWICPKIFLESN